MTRTIPLFLLLFLMTIAACQSAETRAPEETFAATDALADANVTDIVVLPIEVQVEMHSDRQVERDLPVKDLRRMIRRYLIERKDYAAPRARWIDEVRSEGGNLDTDAILSVSVSQWDTSQLDGRGVIYASANFELKAPKSETVLWTYSCNDYQLPLPAPTGGRSIGGNNVAAARLLAQTALSRLPRK